MEFLTELEKEVIRKAGELWKLMCAALPKDSPTREDDLKELVIHIHTIQRAFMANAAARAYPDEFRPVGGVLKRAICEMCDYDPCVCAWLDPPKRL